MDKSSGKSSVKSRDGEIYSVESTGVENDLMRASEPSLTTLQDRQVQCCCFHNVLLIVYLDTLIQILGFKDNENKCIFFRFYPTDISD